MAAGDITWFKAGLLKLGQNKFTLSGTAIKVALIKNTANGGLTPTSTTADPCWGAGGSTNFSTHESTPGGNYSAGGASVGTVTWAQVSNVPVLSSNATVTWAQNASNPTVADYGIIYDNAATNKDCLGFVDLGTTKDLSAAALTVDWGDSPTTNSIVKIDI